MEGGVREDSEELRDRGFTHRKGLWVGIFGSQRRRHGVRGRAEDEGGVDDKHVDSGVGEALPVEGGGERAQRDGEGDLEGQRR